MTRPAAQRSKSRPGANPELVEEAEQAVIDRYTQLVGTEPVGLRDVLHVLTHPDMVAVTQAYLDIKDKSG